jgi:rhodanese-related sulfurtransferase
MNSKIVLTIFILPLAIIVAIFSNNTKDSNVAKFDQLLEDINTRTAYVTTDEVADLLVNKDPSVLLVDVRDLNDFDKFHLPGAVHVPLKDLYNEDYAGWFEVEGQKTILYSNGTTDAQSAWVMLKLKDYENVFVMQGGANYWYETILKPIPPANIEADEEIAKYDFRKAASQYFTGAATTKVASDKPAAPKAPKRKKDKQRAEGGC